MKNLLQIIKAHIFLCFKFANKSKNYQDYYMQINLQKCLLQNKETCWWLERFFQLLDWLSIYLCLLLSGQEGCVNEQQTFSLPILFESLSHGCSSLRWVCHYWWPPLSLTQGGISSRHHWYWEFLNHHHHRSLVS